MSTLVLARLPARTASPAAGPGLLTRILRHVVASRARQADRHIRLYLAQLPDATLRDLGLSPAEISAVRAGRSLPASALLYRGGDDFARCPRTFSLPP